MKIFNKDITNLAVQNDNFRKVVYTGDHSQVVLMSLKPGEEIGKEVHETVDQILVFVSGNGEAVLGDESMSVSKGTLTFVPAGTQHNFVNTGAEDLKLFTIYSPPQHPGGTIHITKVRPL